jgi:cob(I)alamin adenosyltransferase
MRPGRRAGPANPRAVSAHDPANVAVMVRLTRIYTRLGDGGDTHLGDLSRVRKTHARVCAYGDVDETNSAIGVARAAGLPAELDGWLAMVQNDLFDLGADLSMPTPPAAGGPPRLMVTAAQVARLERWCDVANERLEPLTSFVLPAGTPAAAALHLTRTICRRAERAVIALADREPVGPEAVRYLNRLSDLLFILARACNAEAGGDVLWRPGGTEA